MKHVCSLLLIGLVACGDAASTHVPAERPNVVVILIDTLRPDHLPAYGYAENTAPFLSRLASEGVLFKSALSTSTWTAPATASLFTSLHPVQHGVLEGFFVQRARAAEEGSAQNVTLNRLPEGAATLPQHFASSGWRTFGVVANVNVTSRIGFDRGFQQFHDFTGPQYGKGGAADKVLDSLRGWKDELVAEPYFLYLHLNDVHSPWRDREGVMNRPVDMLTKNRMAYDGEIRFVDSVLQRAYEELGWSRNTLLCLVSDHGEEFMEHGQTGHNYSVYGELMRIAMAMSWPERWSEPRVIEEHVGIVDVLPTLAELCGLPYRSGWEGRSLVPLIEDGKSGPRRTFIAHRLMAKEPHPLWAVVRERWKLIVAGERVELYDLVADPLEKNDLAQREPARVAELRRELEEFRERAKPVGNARIDVELDADEVRKLEQLGYTDRDK